MRHNIIRLSLLLLVLAGAGTLHAGRYAGDFMAIGAGVKPLGMGGAFAAVADNADAVYWNPAGLSRIREIEVGLMHAFLYEGLAYYDNATLAVPLPNEVTVALNWTRLSVDDIPEFSEEHLVGTNVDLRSAFPDLHLSGEPDSYFSSTDDLYQFSFSKHVHHDLNLGWYFFELPVDMNFGGTIKYIKREMYGYLGTGTGFDIAFLFRTDMAVLFDQEWMGKLNAGLNFRDLGGTTITWDTESAHEDEVLFTTKLGVAIDQPVPQWNSAFVLAWDMDYEYNEVHHFGLEWQYKRLGALRTGYYDKNFSAGLSLNVYNFVLEYAFVTNTLGNTNRVGLRFNYW